MSRPNHLSVPNTAAGIRRINQQQERYDRDPAAYERQEAERAEMRAREEAELQARYEAEQAEAQARAEFEANH